MATMPQLIANRANAQLSTGPRSEAGKRASAANSLTTGLTAAKLFVRPDEQAEFDAFHETLRNELQPGGAIQTLLFDRILHAAWNLRRCDALEYKIQNAAFSQKLDDATQDDDLGRVLDRTYRYKKMHESIFRRAMADLRQLQTEQIRRRQNQQLMEESILIDTAKIIHPLSHKEDRRVLGFIDAPLPTLRK